MHNPTHAPDAAAGFFVIQLRDYHRQLPIDTLYIPMNALRPFIPVHLTLSAPHRENPAQEYSVNLSLTLEKAQVGQKQVAVSG